MIVPDKYKSAVYANKKKEQLKKSGITFALMETALQKIPGCYN